MKKRLAMLFMCLVMCLTVLTGCNLFPVDTERYMNAVVAVVEYTDGEKDEITKKELLTAIDSYGASLIQNYGMSAEEAVKQTLDVLVNRKVILRETNRRIKLGHIVIANKDKNGLFDQTISALIANIESFRGEVLSDWGLTDVVVNPGEEDIGTIYEPYEKKAEIAEVNGKLVIRIIDSGSGADESLRADFEAENGSGKTAMLGAYNSYIGSDPVLVAAQNKYIKQLLKNEDGMKLSTDRESVFMREIERIYKNLKENMLITKYQELTKNGTGISPISVVHLLDNYKLQVLQSFTKYNANPSQFNSDALENIGDAKYIANDDFFFVSHILVNFSEEQKADYDSLEERLGSGGPSPLETWEEKQRIVNSVIAIERDEKGEIVDSEKNIDTLLKEINLALAKGRTDEEKADIFNSFIYRYNQDPGIMNAEYNYVIGVNDSKMVESFTDAARKLHDAGKVGVISEAVPSTYGVHILFYAGSVKNIFNVSSAEGFNLVEEDVYKLANTRLNLCSNKTVFDKIYEEMINDNYSIFERLNINYLREDLKIEKKQNNFKDLY